MRGDESGLNSALFTVPKPNKVPFGWLQVYFRRFEFIEGVDVFITKQWLPAASLARYLD